MDISPVDADTVIALVDHIHQHQAAGTNPMQTLTVVLDELEPLAARLRKARRAGRVVVDPPTDGEREQARAARERLAGQLQHDTH